MSWWTFQTVNAGEFAESLLPRKEGLWWKGTVGALFSATSGALA
jgi:hypothetical protein